MAKQSPPPEALRESILDAGPKGLNCTGQLDRLVYWNLQRRTAIPRPYFHRVRRRKHDHRSAVPSNCESLLKLLVECVVEPFERLMHTTAIVVPLPGMQSDDDEEPQPNPCHPACAQYASSDYCRESWQLHLAETKRRPEAHWHTCDFGMFCAMVPVAYQSHCLAAVKLACPASISEETFDQNVAFLDILVESFSVSHADFLKRLVETTNGLDKVDIAGSDDDRVSVFPAKAHPHVEQATQYIEAHFSDPGLTVVGVARHLGIHANHLCHLFAKQVGRRMSRFIADCRIASAKTLLATTNHQIKRIAHETGHAHPNWFSHMFTLHTGMTPGEYRIKLRSSPPRNR